MRKWWGLVLVTLSLTGCHMLDKKHNDKVVPMADAPAEPIVLLVAGQSNGTSLGLAASDVAYSVAEAVTIIHDGGIVSRPTKENPLTTSLSWVYLGDMIAVKTGRPVMIVNVSVGATGSDSWATTLANVMPDAIAQYHPLVLLWIQGEDDSSFGFSYATSLGYYETIFHSIHNVRPYCAIDGFNGVEHPYQNVRDAQAKIIGEGLAIQGIDIDMMRHTHPEWFDSRGVHFTGVGLKAHAQAWFDILDKGGLW